MLRKIKIRSQFPENYDTEEASNESGLDTGTEGGAKQSFRDECDINVIVKRFGIGYELPMGLRAPTSGDFTGITDFHQAMNAVRAAQETFEQLPADIRARFQNDPGKFVDFTTDASNREQVKQWGMLAPEKAALQEGKGSGSSEPTQVPEK